MDEVWRTITWRQFGAAIDTLDNALVACPPELWTVPLWVDDYLPASAEYWYLAYHCLFWLDLYLTGAVEGFIPPAPFTLDELDPRGLVPERAYTPDELRTYLAHCRAKCRATIEGMSDERAQEPCRFGWGEASFAELLLYSMRHVQEHAAQLSLLLGQRTDAAPGWVAVARG